VAGGKPERAYLSEYGSKVKNLLAALVKLSYMLETPKAFNTKKISSAISQLSLYFSVKSATFFCNNLKDNTMGNQQGR
jgi:hypothetical protein